MRDHLIEEGKVLIDLFTADEENIRCLSFSGIDPFMSWLIFIVPWDGSMTQSMYIIE